MTPGPSQHDLPMISKLASYTLISGVRITSNLTKYIRRPWWNLHLIWQSGSKMIFDMAFCTWGSNTINLHMGFSENYNRWATGNSGKSEKWCLGSQNGPSEFILDAKSIFRIWIFISRGHQYQKLSKRGQRWTNRVFGRISSFFHILM